MNVKQLRIVLHNSLENRPLWMDFRIDDTLAAAIKNMKVSRAEFLVSDTPIFNLGEGVPDLNKIRKLNDYDLKHGG